MCGLFSGGNKKESAPDVAPAASEPEIHTRTETLPLTETDIKIGKILAALAFDPRSRQFKGIIARALGFKFKDRDRIGQEAVKVFVEKFPTFKSLSESIYRLINSIKGESKQREYRETMDKLCRILFGENYLGVTPSAETKRERIKTLPRGLEKPDDARIIPPGVIEKAHASAKEPN